MKKHIEEEGKLSKDEELLKLRDRLKADSDEEVSGVFTE